MKICNWINVAQMSHVSNHNKAQITKALHGDKQGLCCSSYSTRLLILHLKGQLFQFSLVQCFKASLERIGQMIIISCIKASIGASLGLSNIAHTPWARAKDTTALTEGLIIKTGFWLPETLIRISGSFDSYVLAGGAPMSFSRSCVCAQYGFLWSAPHAGRDPQSKSGITTRSPFKLH